MFPRKFKQLLELETKDVETPDYVWLVYAVCACDRDSCSWGGWIIEAAFKITGQKHHTGTGDKALSSDTTQTCPSCGKKLFRTAAAVRFEPAEDQTPIWIEGVDYESSPMEYED